MSYKLEDGTMSSEYKIGDKFVVVGGNLERYPKDAVITYIENDYSSCPKFSHPDYGDWYEDWSNLEAYQEDSQPTDNKQGENVMKVKRMDYVNTKDFNLDELKVFESLIVDSGYGVDEKINFTQMEFWRYYGVTAQGYTGFYSFYFEEESGRNVSEQFRKYLDSLKSEEEQPVEETSTENLSIKGRLLALAGGKELEWLHVCEYGNCEDWITLESSHPDFGDMLYDESLKVRVKPVPEKSHLTLSFEKYCASLELPSDFTSNLYKFFKAGYDAAKQEND